MFAVVLRSPIRIGVKRESRFIRGLFPQL